MNITSPYGAEFMKQQGATRVVTAREMSLAEIRAIKEHVDIEVETFVHGAMCYSYSGQCLMSSLAGAEAATGDAAHSHAGNAMTKAICYP